MKLMLAGFQFTVLCSVAFDIQSPFPNEKARKILCLAEQDSDNVMASSYIVRGKTYADAVAPKKHKILLAICGCESAAKYGQLIQAFLKWAKVKVIVTKSAKKFVKLPIPYQVAVYMDDDQWILWEKKKVLCLHAELCMWADVMVIAPLSVHALGKIAGGYCDTLLTSVVRAWNCAKKPLFVVPCMDPLWKENYITLRNYVSLDELGIVIITLVIQKRDGKMPEPDEISKIVRDYIPNLVRGSQISDIST